jgi:hypothetical protein
VTRAEFDDRELRIMGALRDKDRRRRLAGVYQTALRALHTPADEDCESARISTICHCMRELMNCLPEAMADNFIRRERRSTGYWIEKLPKLVTKHPDLNLSADQDMVPLPKVVAQAFASLISAGVKEERRNRSNASALITRGDDRKHPAIKQWTDTRRFFVKWAHLDTHDEAERQLPSDAGLRAAMKVVEDIIEVRAAVFFDNFRSVQGMLAEINAPLEDGA